MPRRRRIDNAENPSQTRPNKDSEGTDNRVVKAGRIKTEASPGDHPETKDPSKTTDPEDRPSSGEINESPSPNINKLQKEATTKAKAEVKVGLQEVKFSGFVRKPRCPICGENRCYEGMRGKGARCRNCKNKVTII